MRLTLRTMLAFLDEALEPEDAQVLGKKIEDSEFATNVVHRIRDVMRKLRLGAPAVSGKQMGVDSNTVAEYIDNTLSPERVPDFEKFCLESDIHLAEVASCHQILTLVLRAPAEVSPQSRQRMYRLIHDKSVVKEAASPAAAARPAPEANGKSAAASPVPARKKAEVPDYLKAPSSGERFWRIAAAVVLSALLLGVILMAATPLGNGLPWRREAATASNAGGNRPKSGAVKKVSSGAAATRMPKSRQPEKIASSSTGRTATRSKTAGKLKQPTGANASDRVPHGTRVNASAAGVAKTRVAAKKRGADGESDNTRASRNNTRASRDNEHEATSENDAANDESADEASTDDVVDSPPVDDDDVDESPPLPAAGTMGRVISIGSMLLRADPASGQWMRLPAQQSLTAGDKLLSLPAFRSQVALANDIQLELVGDTQLGLDPPNEDGIPKLYVPYGRVALMTVGGAPMRVELHLGDRVGTAVLEDADATLAIEVRPKLTDGVDPAENQEVKVVLYCAKGRVVWDAPSTDERVVLEAGSHQELGQPANDAADAEANGRGADDEPQAAAVWLAVDGASQSEKKAAETMAQLLPAQGAVSARLLELAAHRRIEVCALAVKCLAAMGQYEPLIDALKDASHHTSWADQVEYLRGSLARGPETCKRVKEALKRRRPTVADKLYRTLWGYSEQDLKNGADATLVGYLNDNDLDLRVLGIWNLRHLTGMHLFYRAEYTESKRQHIVQRWKQRLAAGQIVPKKPPAPRPATGKRKPDDASS